MRRILLLLTASLVMAAMLAVGAGPAMAAKPGGPPEVPQVAACGGLFRAHELHVPERNTEAHLSIPGEDACLQD
jgi:hypothetical protein